MYPIGAVARMTGLTPETIRYYERSGVVPAPGRAANGRRAYSETEIERLRLIRRCRNLGFPMAEARTLLDLSERDDGACRDFHLLAGAHLEGVRTRIADLQRMETSLSELMEGCGPDGARCDALKGLRAAD